MKKVLLFLGAIVMASSAYAAKDRTVRTLVYRNSSTNNIKLLDGVALNASAATRTITVELGPDGDYRSLVVQVDFTHNAATTLVLTPTCSINGGASYASVLTGSVSSGTEDVDAHVVSMGVAGSVNNKYEFNVVGCDAFKIVFSGASGGASDLIDVYAKATSADALIRVQ